MRHPQGIVGGDEGDLAFLRITGIGGSRDAEAGFESSAVGHQQKEVRRDHQGTKEDGNDGAQLSARPFHEAPPVLFRTIELDPVGHCDIQYICPTISYRSFCVKSFVINMFCSKSEALDKGSWTEAATTDSRFGPVFDLSMASPVSHQARQKESPLMSILEGTSRKLPSSGPCPLSRTGGL